MLKLLHRLATYRQRTTVRRVVKARLLYAMEQASALLVYLNLDHLNRLQTGHRRGRLLDWQDVPSGSAGTFAGFVRRATGGNEPCPRGDLDSACRTEEQCCCQRLQVGTRWEEVGDVEEVGQGRRPPVASVHRQALQERLLRERAVARRRGVALRRLCVQPLPPSSLLSIPFGFP